jgi:hypothetical protein
MFDGNEAWFRQLCAERRVRTHNIAYARSTLGDGRHRFSWIVQQQGGPCEHVSCDTASRGPEAFNRSQTRPARPGEKEMRSLIRSIGIAGGILVLAGVQNASAQIEYALDFTTSFPFTVGSATVPAGSYTIRPDGDSPDLLQLSGKDVNVFFAANRAEARERPAQTEVVFKRYGDGYVLKDIWLEASSGGYETLAAEGERHLTKRHGSASSEEHVGARKSASTSSPR